MHALVINTKVSVAIKPAFIGSVRVYSFTSDLLTLNRCLRANISFDVTERLMFAFLIKQKNIFLKNSRSTLVSNRFEINPTCLFLRVCVAGFM